MIRNTFYIICIFTFGIVIGYTKESLQLPFIAVYSLLIGFLYVNYLFLKNFNINKSEKKKENDQEYLIINFRNEAFLKRFNRLKELTNGLPIEIIDYIELNAPGMDELDDQVLIEDFFDTIIK